MWLGIAVNVVVAVPALFSPNTILGLLKIEAAATPIWVSFAANLLILLSLFYVPAAIDPVSYRVNAALAVFARWAGVVFFPRCFPVWTIAHVSILGLIDLVFGLPLTILLFRDSGTKQRSPGVSANVHCYALTFSLSYQAKNFSAPAHPSLYNILFSFSGRSN